MMVRFFNSVLDKDYIKLILKVLIYILSIIYLISFIDFIVYLFESKWFIEPAENENLVLSNYLHNSNLLNLESLIKNGILPIYPDIYHQLSTLINLDNLLSLRLISFICFVLAQVLIFIVSKRITKSFLISLSLALLVFGNVNHSIYFLMARVDSLYFFTGLLSVIILFTIFYKKKFLNQSYIIIFLSGIILTSSILSKQTAIFFLAYSFFLIFYFSKKLKLIKSTLVLLLSITLSLVLYLSFVNPYVFDYYLIGLKGWGSDYSWVSLKSHLGEIILNYYGYLTLILLGVVSILKKKQILVFWIFSFMLILVFSLKLFGNIGAFYNNFILVSFITVIFTIYVYKHSNNRFQDSIFHIILVLILLNSILPNWYSGDLRSSFHVFKSNQILNGEFESNRIFKYVKNSNGKFLTGRNDNFLYFSNKKIYYESSVLSNIVPIRHNIFGLKTTSSLKLLESSIRNKISNQYFDGIIDGIGDNLYAYRNLIVKYYNVQITDTIFSGVHRHEIKLYTKKF